MELEEISCKAGSGPAKLMKTWSQSENAECTVVVSEGCKMCFPLIIQVMQLIDQGNLTQGGSHSLFRI
jgi:hypothetical protein